MTTRLSRRAMRRLVAAGATILSIGCGSSPMEPASRIQPSHAARHDGDPGEPPSEPCRSGWLVNDGRWVCNDIGI
jgi:hypothetical protein